MRTISELAPNIEYVSRFDEEIGALMGDELRRQRRNIELIASENIASAAVIACMGTVLTNKYLISEGRCCIRIIRIKKHLYHTIPYR